MYSAILRKSLFNVHSPPDNIILGTPRLKASSITGFIDSKLNSVFKSDLSFKQ